MIHLLIPAAEKYNRPKRIQLKFDSVSEKLTTQQFELNLLLKKLFFLEIISNKSLKNLLKKILKFFF